MQTSSHAIANYSVRSVEDFSAPQAFISFMLTDMRMGSLSAKYVNVHSHSRANWISTCPVTQKADHINAQNQTVIEVLPMNTTLKNMLRVTPSEVHYLLYEM